MSKLPVVKIQVIEKLNKNILSPSKMHNAIGKVGRSQEAYF